jgi:hypothetical protein
MARGATNSAQGGYTFFTFSKGKFIQRVPEGTEGAVPRVLENGPNIGKTVHEITFDTLEGQILQLEVSESQYGDKLEIYLDVTIEGEPEEIMKITLPFSSSYGKGFLKRIPNLDFSKDLVLKGYDIFNKEKSRNEYFLIPRQDGKIESAFTKENPNGFPQLKKIKVKGKDIWDDTEQLEFLKALIKSTNFIGLGSETTQEETPTVEEEDAFPEPNNEQVF